MLRGSLKQTRETVKGSSVFSRRLHHRWPLPSEPISAYPLIERLQFERVVETHPAKPPIRSHSLWGFAASTTDRGAWITRREGCATSGKGGTSEMGGSIVSGRGQCVTFELGNSEKVELWTSNLCPPRFSGQSRSAALRAVLYCPSPHYSECFCCNRRSAATTSLRPAGLPLGPSPYCWGPAPFFLAPVPVWGASGQALPQTAEPVPCASRAGLATGLSAFATNRHE